MTEEEFERDCHAVGNDIDIALDAHFTFEALNDLAKNGGSRVWTALQRDAQFWVTFRDTLQATGLSPAPEFSTLPQMPTQSIDSCGRLKPTSTFSRTPRLEFASSV